MRMLSDDAVTKNDLTAVIFSARSEIDNKQTQQIQSLKYALAGSFVVNLLITIALFYFK